MELENLINSELNSNPLLEEVDSELEEPLIKEENKSQASDEFSILDFYADSPNFSCEDENTEIEYDPLENIPTEDDKLYFHLLRQAERKFQGRDLEIAELIISNIEDDGYLAVSPEELCQDKYDICEVQKIRKEIQLFDPPGCAWREVKESLLAQLEKMGYKEDSLEYLLVRDYLSQLKNNNYREILKKLNVDEKRFNEARRVLMKLEPRPGLKYSSSTSGYITPDFIIKWQDDKLVALVKDDNIPRIRIKASYLEKLRNPQNLSPGELEFIKEKLQSARNLIFAIEKRHNTLSKIINHLLNYQRDYFLKGQNYLKSITMVDFAKRIGVSPSTVSRAMANKYLESPCGIHKMKFFFSAPLGKTDKGYIISKIRDIIESENPATPFSDSQIAKKLARLGIIISRRTVTKYREQLKIPPHQLRKK